MHEGYEQRMAGAQMDRTALAVARAEYLDWQTGIGPDPAEAAPEVNLAAVASYRHRCYTYIAVVVDHCCARLAHREDEMEAIDLDGDVLLAQMMTAAAQQL